MNIDDRQLEDRLRAWGAAQRSETRQVRVPVERFGAHRGGRTLAIVSAAAAVAIVAAGIAVFALGPGRPGSHSPATRMASGPVDVRPGAPAPSGSSQIRYLGPVRAQTTAAGKELLLDPPTGRTPRLTPQAAYEIFCTAPCGQLGPPDVVLALVTTPESGPAGPNGTVLRPGTDHVLSYVLTWHHVDCHESGPPGSSPLPPSSCTETDPINADTGVGVAGSYIYS